MVVFYLVDRALWQCFKPQLYQTEKTWFCVQVCAKNRTVKETAVCDFINQWSVKTSSVSCMEQILQFKDCQYHM